MHVILDLCVVPMGVGVSVSRYIAACQPILTQAGLEPHLHAYGTTIQGEWDVVFAAVKRCHDDVPFVSRKARKHPSNTGSPTAEILEIPSGLQAQGPGWLGRFRCESSPEAVQSTSPLR